MEVLISRQLQGGKEDIRTTAGNISEVATVADIAKALSSKKAVGPIQAASEAAQDKVSDLIKDEDNETN